MILYLGQCVPYSGQACINAAENLGLISGSTTAESPFAGPKSRKGCYTYYSGENKGFYWYGTGGSNAQIRESLDGPQELDYYRPKGFDCEKGSFLIAKLLLSISIKTRIV